MVRWRNEAIKKHLKREYANEPPKPLDDRLGLLMKSLVKQSYTLHVKDDGYFHLRIDHVAPSALREPDEIASDGCKTITEEIWSKFAADMGDLRLMDKTLSPGILRIYPKPEGDGQSIYLRISPQEIENLRRVAERQETTSCPSAYALN